MGQVLHGSATTTEAVRRAIQHSQESLRALAKRFGIDPKTVTKWRKRTSVSDLQTGPKKSRSTVLELSDRAPQGARSPTPHSPENMHDRGGDGGGGGAARAEERRHSPVGPSSRGHRRPR
jgi:hypothetical protein